jgi:hypothetical protein
MQKSTQGLKGNTIVATDGDIGKVADFYFDDEDWTIRYLVADTGNWLSGGTCCSRLSRSTGRIFQAGRST